jgi:PfaB family protein
VEHNQASESYDKIAITGMGVASRHWTGLADFDRAIYEGHPAAPSGSGSPKQWLLNAAAQALQEAGFSGERRVALLLVSANTGETANGYYHKTPAAGEVALGLQLQGPVVDVADGSNSVFRALKAAQSMLQAGEVEAALIVAAGRLQNGLASDIAAGALVLQLHHSAFQTKRRIYGIIEAFALGKNLSGSGKPSEADLAQVGRWALANAGQLDPAGIGYLEVTGHAASLEDETEIRTLAGVYGSAAASGLTCAVGSLGVTTTLEGGAARSLFALIKTALCLYHRYIPGVAGWEGPQHPAAWNASPFYVSEHARPWFLEKGQTQRRAALSHRGSDGAVAHLILAEAPQPAPRPVSRLEEAACYLLPLAAADQPGLLARLEELGQRLAQNPSLAHLAQHYLANFRPSPAYPYVLSLVAHDPAQLRQEIEKAKAGLPLAFSKGSDWKTPLGSYFTPQPLGAQAPVAFVYPGAFNSYVGLGRELFRLFPGLHDSFARRISEPGEALNQKLLYPRQLEKLTQDQSEALEERLQADQVGMVLSGSSFAVLFTTVMRDYFKLQPAAAFGYSLGETSMLWAMGVWTDFDRGVGIFKDSALFRSRLTGPKDTIREIWQLPSGQPSDEFWSTYFLLASPERVALALQSEPRVYLTHINTSEEVVISGESAGCRRVIQQLKCHYLHRPNGFVLHCEPARAEYPEIMRINALPARPVSDVTFYSSANYRPMALDIKTITHTAAEMTCLPVNFPRLVNRVYEDGARIFIELGPGNTCTRWIGKALKRQPHLALNINQKGVPDSTSLIKVLARLISHGVPLDLTPLCSPGEATRLKTLPNLGHQHFNQNAAQLATVHANFLADRQLALGQMRQLIGSHLNLLQTPTSLNGGNTMPNNHESQASSKEAVLTAVKVENAVPAPVKTAPALLFSEEQIKEFATGSVVKCFGPEYAPYNERRVSRIPNGDLLMMSRITEITGAKTDFNAVSTIRADYEVPAAPWFCQQNSYPFQPYFAYMETALQPCGFLSAYKGSSLLFADKDLYFRNLDGQAILLQDLDLRGQTVTTQARLLSTAMFDGTIIQRFEFETACAGEVFYRGESSFGFFSREVMLKQVGLDGGKLMLPWLEREGHAGLPSYRLHLGAPEAQAHYFKARPGQPYCHLAGNQLDFLDEIVLVPGGGHYKQGYIYASRKINPADWFYRCHFYQDPVMPGSLGVEAMLEAMQAYALHQELGGQFRSPRFGQLAGQTVSWKYRGQIAPDNHRMYLEIHLKSPVIENGRITLTGDASLWKDQIRIYEIKQLGLTINEA